MINSSTFVESFRKYDFVFFGISSAIFFIGILNLYSITHLFEGMTDLYWRQIGWFALSFVIGLAFSFINTSDIYRYSWFFYFLLIGFLILVLIMGDVGMGARRWLVFGPIRFQPSEIAKITTVLALARWFSKYNPEGELGFKQLIIPAIITFVPMMLIVMEPDLGTGLLLLLVFFSICFYRKLKWRTLAILGMLGILSGFAMYDYGLKEYQKKRVLTFLNPEADLRGSGYNAVQSKIAIGSGRFWGKGFKKSSQASLRYLPENHTDFVFSIFNEEHGFVGSIFLIALYLILFYRFIWLATSVPRIFDSIVVIGLMSILFWHTFINMCMVMGLLPIVGLPLPFMSYGGTSLVTFGICCGLSTALSNARNLF